MKYQLHPSTDDLELAFACRYLIKEAEELEFQSCDWITDAGLGALKDLDNLKRLGLKFHLNLFSESFREFPSLSSLTDLDLDGCTHVKNQHLMGILKQCPHLKTINLSYCPYLRGLEFVEVMRQGKNLEEISLQASLLTYNDVVNLIHAVPKLKKLDLSLCENITDGQLQELSKTLNLFREDHRKLSIIRG